MEMDRASITNVQVAEDIGQDYTTVSRYRSGQRLPSLEVMLAIERAYGWTVQQQAVAANASREEYAVGFEAALSRHVAATPA
jgi:transcriptional regulator with XRE-family HTH domain